MLSASQDLLFCRSFLTINWLAISWSWWANTSFRSHAGHMGTLLIWCLNRLFICFHHAFLNFWNRKCSDDPIIVLNGSEWLGLQTTAQKMRIFLATAEPRNLMSSGSSRTSRTKRTCISKILANWSQPESSWAHNAWEGLRGVIHTILKNLPKMGWKRDTKINQGEMSPWDVLACLGNVQNQVIFS